MAVFFRGIHEKILEGDPEKWADIINLNLLGTLRLARAILPFMKSGHVVFISSVSAKKTIPTEEFTPQPKAPSKPSPKHFALKNCPVCGVVNTSFFESMESGNHTVETIACGAVEPSDIAAAVLFAINNPPQTFVNHLTISLPGQPQ